MPIENLTATRVAGLKHAAGEIIDAKSGLIVRADREGRVSFSYRYRIGGARRRLALGRFPEVSLADARAAVGKVRAQVREGHDPQAERQARRAGRPATLTVEALAALFLERYSRRVKASWREDARYLRTNVLPVWGEIDAASIKRQDVTRLLFEVAGRAPVAANRLRAMLSKLFSWAVDARLLDDNPTLGVKKPSKEVKGKTSHLERPGDPRALAGIRRGQHCARHHCRAQGFAAHRQRPAEVAHMAADELHHLDDAAQAVWSLPAHRMKARRDHLVPLPPLTAQIVRMERRQGGRPQFVFTSRSGARLPRASLARILADLINGLDADGADADVIARLKADRPTAHDCRRTVATNLSRLGIPREDRLSVLAHAQHDVHGRVYDLYDRLSEKRVALLTWEQHVRILITGKSGGAEIVAASAQRRGVS